MKKPIKVFYSVLTGRFFASQHYKPYASGIVITGAKYDVTDDIGAAVTRHSVTFKKIKAGTKEGA